MNVDLQSVAFTAASFLLGVGILAVAFGRNSSRAGPMGWIGSGTLAIGAGLLGMSLRGIVPDFVSMCVANATLATGFILLYLGCRRSCDPQAQIPVWLVGIVLLEFAFLVLTTTLWVNPSQRLIAISATGLILNGRWMIFMLRDFAVAGSSLPRRLVTYAPVILSGLFLAMLLDVALRTTPLSSPAGARMLFFFATITLSGVVSATALLMLWLDGHAALLAARERTESILRILPDAVTIQDRNGNYLRRETPPSMATEVQEHGLAEALSPDVAGARLGAILEALNTGELQVFEYPMAWQGQSYWQEARIIPYAADQVLTLTRDVTERKAAEGRRLESEATLGLISENMGDVIGLYHPDGSLRYVSPSVRDALGYESAEALGLSPYRFIHSEDHPVAMRARDRAMAGESNVSAQYRMRHRSGEYIWMEVRYQCILGTDRKVISMITSAHDISERRALDEQLRLAAMVAHSASDGVVVSDTADVVQWANDAFLTMIGAPAELIVGASYQELLGSRLPAGEGERRRELLEREGHLEAETVVTRQNGSRFPAWHRVSVVRDPAGLATHLVQVLVDRSEEHQARETIEHLTRHDPLTKLPNRYQFTQTLTKAIAAAPEDRVTVALLSINIDRFKRLNGLLGQSDGDRLLRGIAGRLVTMLELAHAVVARAGGDEFAVLMTDLAGPAQAIDAARSIMGVLARPFDLGSEDEVFVTSSIGIGLYPTDGQSADAIMRAATTAMHHAKRSGGNAFRSFAADMDSRDAGQLLTEARLRRAAESKAGLSMHYQPKLGVVSNRIDGLEALIRWHHPDIGDVPPDQFIPLAEELGLIHGLGEWVLPTVCSEAVAREKAGFGAMRIAVNLSPKQLLDELLPEKIQMILDETGLDPRHLELEVTETCVMVARDQAARLLERLRSLGIGLCLDDFGTGHSSLSYLSSLPVDSIKIDRSFVSGLPSNLTNVAICKAVIAMGRALDIKVVAEGVEREAELAFLEEQGCDEIQGNLIARPLSDAALREFLRADHSPALLRHGAGEPATDP